MWTNGLTDLDCYKGQCYNKKPWGGKSIYCLCSLPFIPFFFFKKVMLLTCLLLLWGNVFGFKALFRFHCSLLWRPPISSNKLLAARTIFDDTCGQRRTWNSCLSEYAKALEKHKHDICEDVRRKILQVMKKQKSKWELEIHWLQYRDLVMSQLRLRICLPWKFNKLHPRSSRMSKILKKMHWCIIIIKALVPTILRQATWILFLHFNLSYAKSSDSLHFFDLYRKTFPQCVIVGLHWTCPNHLKRVTKMSTEVHVLKFPLDLHISPMF